MTRAVSSVVRTSAVAVALIAPAAFGQDTSNPFTSDIATGDIAVRLVDVATIPNSAGAAPRLNFLAGDGTGRVFVNDQRGALYALPAGGGSPTTPYLNLRDFPAQTTPTSGDGEQGFQSFAFHPNFAAADQPGFGTFYTASSTTNKTPTPDFATPTGDDHDEIVLEWQASNPANDTFSGSVREVLRITRPQPGNHNGGGLGFNPTAAPGSADFGKLYYSMGDSGGSGDPQDLAENPANPYGAILRIDPLGSDPGKRYAVPDDNPFANDTAGDATLGEVYAYGLRNPQRFSWDEANGNLFIGDIGQGVIEEIDLGAPGANYGWDDREGSFGYVNSGTVSQTSTPAGLTDPIAEYDHVDDAVGPADRQAVSGGYAYRGDGVADLFGQYVFGDLSSGEIFYFDADDLPDGGQDELSKLQLFDADGLEVTLLELIRRTNPGATRTDLRFGVGDDGELFVLNKQDGIVRQIVAVPEPAGVGVAALAGVALLRRRRRIPPLT